MLYCDQVIDVCKAAQHPLTAKTIAWKLGISRKEAKASLWWASEFVDKNLTVTIRNPMNNYKKRPIWTYKKTQ